MKKRFENLKFKGKDTGYRYMGSIEEAQTLGTFYEDVTHEDSVIANILDADEYVSVDAHCKGIDCENYATCELKDGSLEDRTSCYMYGFLDKDVSQTIVYYNEKLHSAVVFEVAFDCVIENYGFETIEELIDHIMSGVDSPYANSFKSNVLVEEFTKVLEIPNNVIYFWHLNSDHIDDFVDCHYRSLKGKRVRTLIDIIKEL